MSNVLVQGTDGIRPQYDPEALFKIWAYEEIYLGDEGKNKYVPKVNDLVYRAVQNKYLRVISLDLNTLIPTLSDIGNEGEEDGGQLLIGDGAQPSTFRLYYDTSKLPYTASIDSRHYVNGSENTYARVFKGTDTSPAGKVISAVFNGANYIDDKIPLELIVYDNHTNLARKAVPSFHTREILADGEVCTVVIYNSQNIVTHKKTLLVEKTAFIRPVNSAQKYISSISLKSLFLNSNDPYVLDFPLNVPLGGLNVEGVLHYSDGSERVLPVDGSKFSLFGISNFVATRPGQRIPLVLNYRLDDDEAVYGAVSADGKKITEPYTLVTTHENGVFSPVLFGYPYWDNTQNTYKLRWWLMDLNRVTLFDASTQVLFNETSEIFDGNNYNTIQKLSVRVNLANVSQTLPDWIHTQTLYVKLYDPTLTVRPAAKFEVGQENVDGTFYGTDLVARVNTVDQNNHKINIGNNLPTLMEWLDQLYFKARPVYSLYREATPPTPTHFTILNDLQNTQTFPISLWNQQFSIFTNIQGKSNLIVRWERHLNNSSILQLATTEIPFEFIT